MRFLFVLALALITSAGYAQNFIDANYSQYEDLEETTVVHVTGKTFEIASYVIPTDDEETAELAEFVGSITALDVIAVPELATARAEYDKGVSLLAQDFEELLNIKEKSNRFSVYIDEEGGTVYELVGIGVDDSEFIVVSLTGEMRLDLIGAIINKMEDFKGMEPLAKLKEYKATDFTAYPNPASSGTTLSIDIPETMIGGVGRIYDLQGAAVNEFSITTVTQQLRTSGLQPGTYVIGLEKDDVSIKKQVVIVR